MTNVKNSVDCSDDSFDEEEISLTEEQIALAVKISEPVNDRELQWAVYMASLGYSAFATWLDERDDELKIDTSKSQLFSGLPTVGAASQLEIGGFKVCVITKGALDGDYVNTPKSVLVSEDQKAQFYVFVEVFEEMAEAMMFGFLRSDKLQAYYDNDKESLPKFDYQTCDIPIDWMNLEFDELISYLRCFNPEAIPLVTLNNF